jgi:hypothetical protein
MNQNLDALKTDIAQQVSTSFNLCNLISYAHAIHMQLTTRGRNDLAEDVNDSSIAGSEPSLTDAEQEKDSDSSTYIIIGVVFGVIIVAIVIGLIVMRQRKVQLGHVAPRRQSTMSRGMSGSTRYRSADITDTSL